MRLLFFAMEATFSFMFWAMYSKTKDYGMSECCPWPRKSFSYGGLCSHSSLAEGVHGQFDLSVEQLESMAAEHREQTRLRRKEYNSNYHRNYIQTQHGKATRRRGQQIYKKNNPSKVKANRDTSAAKVKSSGKYFCATCNVYCSKPWELERHNKSRRHLTRVKKTKAGRIKYHCALCGYSRMRPCELERHQAGKIHKAKAAAAAAGESIDEDSGVELDDETDESDAEDSAVEESSSSST